MSETPSARLNSLTLARNIPVAATLELTRRCPLSCLHCYLPETRGRAEAGRELSTGQWKNIIKQLAGSGALYLVFTGGEPLLRADLPELCRFAKGLNLDVRVYSTGLGLTPAKAGEFAQAGVSAFELSFYGRPATHDAITGVEGSFRRSLASARLLKKAGLKVKLKTPLMKMNFAQAGWLKSLAEREGFKLSFDAVITSANDGNRSALSQRLTGQGLAQAVKLLGPAITSGQDLSAAADRAPLAGDVLCGAGRNVCAVGAEGELYPCLQLQVKLGDLSRRKFTGIWRNSAWLKKWRSAGFKDLKGCAGCADMDVCSRCPGVSYLEAGDVFAPNKPACGMANIQAKLRRKAV
jgi:radical SAM protein with 4Fe4S-binding SPASM domain